MRKLVYFVASTLDGFISREDGSWDIFPSEGEHISYVAAEYPETIPGHLRRPMGVNGPNRHFGAVIMGRVTWGIGADFGITSPYPHLDQYLVSTTLEHSPDPAVTLIRSDPLSAVRDLKKREGADIWLCGGGALAGTLAPEVDELVLKLAPVVLGSGIPLFRHLPTPLNLDLLDHRAFSGGVALHRYRVNRGA